MILSEPRRTPGLLAFCTFSMDWKACLTALGWWILLLGLWILFLTCPMGKLSSFLRNSSYRRTTINPADENKNSRLVEMTLGLVHAIYGLPKWRAEYRLRVCLHDLKYWNKLNLTQDEIKQFLKNFQSLFVYPLVHHAHIYYSSRFIASKKKFCSYIVFLKKLTFGVSFQW